MNLPRATIAYTKDEFVVCAVCHKIPFCSLPSSTESCTWKPGFKGLVHKKSVGTCQQAAGWADSGVNDLVQMMLRLLHMGAIVPFLW